MALNPSQLMQAARKLATARGCSVSDAARLLSTMSDDDKQAFLDDKPAAPPLKGRKGASIDEKTQASPQIAAMTDISPSRSVAAIPPSVPAATPSDDVPRIDGDIISPGTPDDLPDGLGDTIQDIILGFCSKIKVDEPYKMAAEQWGACCMDIGRYIKQNRIIVDEIKSRAQGGIVYNPHKILPLLDLWYYFCGVLKKAPLAFDFCSFVGVSFDYLQGKDSKGNVLTSAHLEIKQKVLDIQAAGLSSRLVDGRINPTGTIYFTKARLGWREDVHIVHDKGATAVNMDALPDLSTFLSEKGGES